MKNLFVSDEQAIISIQGIRYITKEDSIAYQLSTKSYYYLKIAYKGQEKNITYDDPKKRDDLFNQLKTRLGEGK
jgi:hypothetical protein